MLRPSIDVDPLFLGYALDCPESAAQKAGMGRGFTVVHIYAGQLKNLGMAIPTRPEQIAIAAFLDRETAKIDALISEAEQAILLLQERRTALISAAVTGKIDVRGLVQQEAA